MFCFRHGWHHEHVARELVPLEWKQEVRDACVVQGGLGMKKMLTFVVQRCPRAPAAVEPACSACLAKSIRSDETNGRFGSEQVQIRPDLILQQLPKIEITEFAESLCQHAGDEECRRKPLCWIAGSHSPPLLCDEFSDRQSNSQSQ